MVLEIEGKLQEGLVVVKTRFGSGCRFFIFIIFHLCFLDAHRTLAASACRFGHHGLGDAWTIDMYASVL
jgi:hypothetical protein